MLILSESDRFQYRERIKINIGKLDHLSDLNQYPERIYRLHKLREWVEYAFNM